MTCHATAYGTEDLIKLTVLPIFIQLRSDKAAEAEEFSIYSSSTTSRGAVRPADVFSRLAQDILYVIDEHT